MAKEVKEPKGAKEVKGVEFLNPFNKGVSYAQFLEAKGDLTVVEYCEGKLEPAQIEWLIIELEHFKNK